MDRYTKEVMTALTSKDYPKAVEKYLLTYDLENWKVFTDNYYKLTPYEAECILDVIRSKMDIHMVIDILSLAYIIGQSISLTSQLLEMFSAVNCSAIENDLFTVAKRLIKSPIAEERRVGVLLVGTLEISELVDELERMTDYDILFEDVYYALGLLDDPKIIQKLVKKFVILIKNQVQRNAIAKILVQKGNPLATLWLIQKKGLTIETPRSKTYYISRELAWMGVRPSLFLESEDTFLRTVCLKIAQELASIIEYEINLIPKVNLGDIVQTLNRIVNKEPNIQLIKILYNYKVIIDELYYNLNPYSLGREIRNEITKAWNIVRKFPSKEVLNYIHLFVDENLTLDSTYFREAVQFIKNFKLAKYHDQLLSIVQNNTDILTTELEFETLGCFGEIGTHESAEYIYELLQAKIDAGKRNQTVNKIIEFHSDLDYYDDFYNDHIRKIHRAFQTDIALNERHKQEELFYLYALHSIAKIKSERSLELLVEALDDYDPRIRLEAIYGLKNFENALDFVEEKLVNMITHDPYMSIQREAIITLSALNSEASVPIFIRNIFSAIEDGTLALPGEVDTEVYDPRWDVSSGSEIHSDQKELGATPNLPRSSIPSKNKLIDNDIARWLNRLNSTSSKQLELREDFDDNDFALPLLSDDADEEEYSEIIDLGDYDFKGEVGEVEESSEDEVEWFGELGEQFRKITLIESSIEALKSTKAPLPIDEIKEFIEHPVDEELYKDALIILAKTGEVFAIKELQGLFNHTDFIRAREIVETIWTVNKKELEPLKKAILQSPDWVLKEIIKSEKTIFGQ